MGFWLKKMFNKRLEIGKERMLDGLSFKNFVRGFALIW
jgi:hypothetical protein